MILSPELLAILACPKCKAPVRQQPDPPVVVCDACQLCYPIRDGIPVMLVDEAMPIQER